MSWKRYWRTSWVASLRKFETKNVQNSSQRNEVPHLASMGALDQLKFSGLSPDQVDQLPPHLRHRCGVVFVLCCERVSQLAGGLADGHGLAVRENILQTQQNVPTAVAQLSGMHSARRNGSSTSGDERRRRACKCSFFPPRRRPAELFLRSEAAFRRGLVPGRRSRSSRNQRRRDDCQCR